MQYNPLGTSDLNVSRICLGTVFRSQCDEATCVAAIHQAADLGCNYLDCANVYRKGFSEQAVGQAIKGRRDQFVVSTKVGAAMDGGPSDGGQTRANILAAAEASLSRLGTDYLDCYLCHFPDPATPLEETLGALDTLVKTGKVRYPGCSNYEPWRLDQALQISRDEAMASFVCNQVQYNMLHRIPEAEMMPFCEANRIGMTVYAPTAIGLLSGRYRRGQAPPEGTSWHRGPYNYRAAMTPETDSVIAALLEMAERHGRTPIQVALAWCLHRPVVSTVIIGADTTQRVRDNFEAADWTLPQDDWQRLCDLFEGHCLTIRKDCPEGYQE